MIDLIERLEKATGPDAGLDVMIAEAIGLKTWHGTTGGFSAALNYTGSIDMALTLVPNDFDYEVTINGTADEETYTCAAIRWWREGKVRNAAGWLHRSGNAKTTAVALCIAALKARSAITTGNSKDAT